MGRGGEEEEVEEEEELSILSLSYQMIAENLGGLGGLELASWIGGARFILPRALYPVL